MRATLTDELANAELAQNIIDAENERDYERVFSVVAEGALWHVPTDRRLIGRAAIRRAAQSFYTAFPDHRRTVDRMVSGDRLVTVQWTLTGSHLGPWLEIRPTRRPISISGCSIWEFDDLRLIAGWVFVDAGDVLRQLGLSLPRRDEDLPVLVTA